MASWTAKHTVGPTERVTLAHVWHEVAELRAEVARMTVAIEQALPPVLASRAWITVDEASTLSGRSPQAVRAWCRSRRIGTRVRGMWQVDREQLRRMLTERFGEGRLPAGLRDAEAVRSP